MYKKHVKRFFEMVRKTRQCWLWTGRVYPQGYGCFYVDGKYFRPHQFSWALVNGDVPSKQWLICCKKNRSCVNPKHIKLTGSSLEMRKDTFWSKVKKKRRCWEWKGSALKTGYGLFGMSAGRRVGAHRAAWILTFGSIPNGLFVCHHCDNPCCVRPSHLFLGTHADNTRDMTRKNRQSSGSRNAAAKLTEKDVRFIKEIGRTRTGVGLGKQFGVHHSTIYDILNHKSWVRV